MVNGNFKLKQYPFTPYFDALCILLQQIQIKQMETNTLKTIERRSLVPRMIYLSLESAASSVKANIKANGSLPENQVLSELRILLERYANILGFSFHDAVNMISKVPSGYNSSEVLI